LRRHHERLHVRSRCNPVQLRRHSFANLVVYMIAGAGSRHSAAPPSIIATVGKTRMVVTMTVRSKTDFDQGATTEPPRLGWVRLGH
jgi:hypothetical protein